MTTAALLIVLGTLCRLAPHPPNFVAMGALALFSGARLPRRYAFLVPLLTMVVSDVAIDWGTGQPAWTLTRFSIYATFALLVLLGRGLKDTRSPMTRMGASLGASTLFFLTTNLAVWLAPQVASPGHPTFPATGTGLIDCYLAAVPFFGNAITADLIGTAVLFGLDGLASRVTFRKTAPATVAVE